MEPMLRCGLGHPEFKRLIVPENSEHCKLVPVDVTVEHCDLVKISPKLSATRLGSLLIYFKTFRNGFTEISVVRIKIDVFSKMHLLPPNPHSARCLKQAYEGWEGRGSSG
jgi:hypothetical protein